MDATNEQRRTQDMHVENEPGVPSGMQGFSQRTKAMDVENNPNASGYMQALSQRMKNMTEEQIRTLERMEAGMGPKLGGQGLSQRSADATQVGGSHYKDMPVQPWDVQEAILTPEEFVGFLKGCIIKYSMRQGLKDSDDAGKNVHCIAKLKEIQA